jgi:hypothetical protein
MLDKYMLADDPDFPRCPACGVGILRKNIQWGERFKEMISEIKNPLRLLRAWIPVYHDVTGSRHEIY